MERTYYSILEVTETASAEAIRGAYRYLTQRWHPDKNLDQREHSELITKQLNEAFDVLSDAGRRAQYDQWLASKRHIKVNPGLFQNIEIANNISSPPQKPQDRKSIQHNKSPLIDYLRIFLIASVVIVGFFTSLAGMFIFENLGVLGVGLIVLSIIIFGINRAFDSAQRVRPKSIDDKFKKEIHIDNWLGTKQEWKDWRKKTKAKLTYLLKASIDKK